MIRHGIGAGFAVAWWLAGCGGQVVRDPPEDLATDSDGSGDGNAGLAPVTGLCVSAGWTDPRQPVAIGFSLDHGFSLLRADGSGDLVVRTPTTFSSMSWASIDREHYFAVRLVWETNNETRVRGTTFSRAGDPTWELDAVFAGISPRQTFRMSPWGATLASDNGSHLMLPSGEQQFAPGFVARTAANAAGWVLGFTDETTGAHGWARFGDEAIRPTRLPLVPPADPSDSPTQNAYLHVFTLVYLGRDGEAIDIVVEKGPDLVRRYPIVATVSDIVRLEQVSSDVYLTYLDGVPRFALMVSTGHLTSLDLPQDVGSSDEFAASETHLVVVRDGSPTWRVDLLDGTTAPFTDDVGADPATIEEYLGEGRYIAARGRAAPLWVVDASTGSAWRPGAELGLGTLFSTSPCGSETALLEDGTTAFGIRNAETGGLLASDASGNYRSVGVEHARFDGFPTVDRIEQTWVYTTRSLDDCAPSEPWRSDATLGAEVVSGAAAVVVPPAGAPFVFPEAAVAPVHESGWCTFHDGVVYDLGTREEHEFETASLRWLAESF
jgi:hypothetical protein